MVSAKVMTSYLSVEFSVGELVERKLGKLGRLGTDLSVPKGLHGRCDAKFPEMMENPAACMKYMIL